jgi:hypothetical protein
LLTGETILIVRLFFYKDESAVYAIGETAAHARVHIGCENCCSEQRFLLSPREFETFLNDVNSPWVSLLVLMTYLQRFVRAHWLCSGRR